MVNTELAIYSMRASIISSFAQFEMCLRAVGSHVHFWAVSPEFFSNQLATEYPLEREGKLRYTILVTVNGVDKAVTMLKDLRISTEENSSRLETTDTLTLKKL